MSELKIDDRVLVEGKLLEIKKEAQLYTVEIADVGNVCVGCLTPVYPMTDVSALRARITALEAQLAAERERSGMAQAEVAGLRETLDEIRVLARTGLPPADMTEDYWKQHKLNRISGMASLVLDTPPGPAGR